MPSIREFKLKDGSVKTMLARSKHRLLPDELLEDPLARWILEFDQPLGKHRHKGNPSEASDPMVAMLVKEVSERVVQPTLSFYHAALMHFGPQWVVAEEGLERARALLENDNLERSASEVEARLQLSVDQGGARDRVSRFAYQLANAWYERINLVTRAWETWRKEVDELKTAMHRAENDISATHDSYQINTFNLVEHCLKPSRLTDHGFPDRRKMALGQTISLVALAGLVTFSRGRPSGRDPFIEVNNYLKKFVRADEERIRIPIMVEEIRALEVEYAGFDPFEHYRSEFTPADGALHRLGVHNRHYGGEPSRWLREFHATLRTLSAWPLPNALFAGNNELHRLVEWGVITADAEIKRRVVDSLQAFNPHSTQETFERNWVARLAREFFKNDAEPGSSSALLFYDLVYNVAIILAEHGNAITAPSKERLRRLVARIGQDRYFYGDW